MKALYEVILGVPNLLPTGQLTGEGFSVNEASQGSHRMEDLSAALRDFQTAFTTCFSST